jgi:UDP-N-acetyl-2-amino-2-deoxyglucuronate dehydrogenase
MESGKKIFTILQLRLHPVLIDLKNRIDQSPPGKRYDIDLTYITSRGKWYFISWKGDIQKSGGIATNIGIHFFDMLIWIFGGVRENIVHLLQPNKASGCMELEKARVRWFLSLDCNDLPQDVKENGKRTYRCITLDEQEIEFSEGFADLHTKSYEEILAGRGFGMMEAKSSIETVYTIRNANPVGLKGECHKLCIAALKNKH